MRKVIALMMFTLIALTAGAQTIQKKVYNEQSTPMGQNNKAEDNSVISAIMSRRSIRKYLDKPVAHEKLALLAQCGINAPSGMNQQPWAVRVVESKEWIDATTAIFRKANPDMVSRDKNFKNMFRNAPNVICVATPDGQSSVDEGMLGENIMLAAQSMGLGTCCLGGPVRFLNDTEACKPYLAQLSLPEGITGRLNLSNKSYFTSLRMLSI